MRVVHLVVPDTVDDPQHPSGGNVYDRRVSDELAEIGWTVHERLAPGRWPEPDTAASTRLAAQIARIPDGALVVVDGLIASSVPEILVPEAPRISLVVLMHMPLGVGPPGCGMADPGAREAAVLSAATAVLTPSSWTRRRLIDSYGLPPGRVHVAQPGVDPARLAPGTPAGGGLLCVAAVTHGKGHDLLLTALAGVADLPWHCVCVGSLDRDAAHADRVRRQADEAGIGGRVVFTGAQPAEDLDVAYAAADVLVLASRAETYGMVVTEALARGLPVLATAVGGVPEALGTAGDGSLPGLLVPPDDPVALAGALRGWLGDADLRQRLKRAAGQRRQSLSGWSRTAAQISRVLTEVAA